MLENQGGGSRKEKQEGEEGAKRKPEIQEGKAGWRSRRKKH